MVCFQNKRYCDRFRADSLFKQYFQTFIFSFTTAKIFGHPPSLPPQPPFNWRTLILNYLYHSFLQDLLIVELKLKGFLKVQVSGSQGYGEINSAHI